MVKVIGIEAQYEKACDKRVIYAGLSIIMVILVVVGYFAESGFVLPEWTEIVWFPLNFGMFGMMGCVTAGVALLVLVTLYRLVVNVIEKGIIVGFLSTALFYLIVAGIGVEIIIWFFNSAPMQEGGAIWRVMNSGMEIPSPSGRLGAALLTSALYDVPFVLFVVKAVHYFRVCKELKEPAAKAKMNREAEEQRAEEDRVKQKQARKEQKRAEQQARAAWQRREQEAWEKYKQEQSAAQDFYFFENCTTRDQLDTRYETLMRAYPPDGSSGDAEIAKTINRQYNEAKKSFSEEDKETKSEKPNETAENSTKGNDEENEGREQ